MMCGTGILVPLGRAVFPKKEDYMLPNKISKQKINNPAGNTLVRIRKH
jgi:hypothetical protein